MNTAQETLVIVHLSSIDSYIRFYGVNPAIQLVTDIKMAITTHPGPTVVMDQEDNDISEDAKVMRASVLDLKKYEIKEYYPFTLFHHDEMMDASPWQDGMKALAKLLRQFKTNGATNRVRLGGLWTSQNGQSGCVHEVQRQLRARSIPSYIDRKICALEDNDLRAVSQ